MTTLSSLFRRIQGKQIGYLEMHAILKQHFSDEPSIHAWLTSPAPTLSGLSVALKEALNPEGKRITWTREGLPAKEWEEEGRRLNAHDHREKVARERILRKFYQSIQKKSRDSAAEPVPRRKPSTEKGNPS